MAVSNRKVSNYTSWVAHDRSGGQAIQDNEHSEQVVATDALLLSYDRFMIPPDIAQRLFITLIVHCFEPRLLFNVFLTGGQVASKWIDGEPIYYISQQPLHLCGFRTMCLMADGFPLAQGARQHARLRRRGISALGLGLQGYRVLSYIFIM